jgi:hypothetical protein
MEIIFYFVLFTALTLFGGFYLLEPLLKPKRQLELVAPDNLTQPKAVLLEERDRTYQALAELDLDYKAGNLSESDYQEVRSQYKEQAVQALIDLDEYEEQYAQLSEAVEAEISRVRTELQASANKKKKVLAE